MKHLFRLIVAAIISTMSLTAFAAQPSETATLLGNAWKSQPTLHAKQDKNAITMVYGGADVVNRKPRIPALEITA